MTELYIPLKFWFNKNPESALIATHQMPDERESYNFCDCVPSNVLDIVDSLMNDVDEEKISDKIKQNVGEIKFLNHLIGITIDYINNFTPIKNKIVNKYENEKDELIKYCIEFLLADNNEMFQEYTGYITIYSFIYHFLKIPDNGYPYIVMQYLENKKITEHGCAIRCAYLKNPELHKLENCLHIDEIVKEMRSIN